MALVSNEIYRDTLIKNLQTTLDHLHVAGSLIDPKNKQELSELRTAYKLINKTLKRAKISKPSPREIAEAQRKFNNNHKTKHITNF